MWSAFLRIFRIFLRIFSIFKNLRIFAHFAHFLAHFLRFWGKFSAFFNTSRGLEKNLGKILWTKIFQKSKKVMKIVENFKIGQNIKVLHIKIFQIFWNVQISYFYCKLDIDCQDRFSILWKILSRFHMSAFLAHFFAHFCAFFAHFFSSPASAFFPPPAC